jgi:hypothetical protein
MAGTYVVTEVQAPVLGVTTPDTHRIRVKWRDSATGAIGYTEALVDDAVYDDPTEWQAALCAVESNLDICV